jgi:hypothetical protein
METAQHESGQYVRLVLDNDLYREIENWRRQQETIPSKAAAIRRLLARALANEGVAA